jgi:hypothetical protein
MTIGELKLHICQDFDIMPNEQQLTFNDILLLDDSKVLSEYGISPLRPIYLEQIKGGVENYKSNEIIIVQSPQREIGFEGTILSGILSQQQQKK